MIGFSSLRCSLETPFYINYCSRWSGRGLIYGVLASKKHLGSWPGRWEVSGGEGKRAEGREGVSGGLAAGSRGRCPARGKGFVGDACDPGSEIVLGLSPLCSEGEEEIEKGFGAGEGLSPCPTSPGDAWGMGSAGEPGSSRGRGAPVGARPHMAWGWEEGRGRNVVGETQKTPGGARAKG